MTIARRLAPLLLLLGACAKREAALPRSVAPTDEEIWIIARAGETSGRTSTPHAPRMLAGTTPDATPLALERTDVQATVVGPFAALRVRQIYAGPERATEGAFVLPLPPAAVFHDLDGLGPITTVESPTHAIRQTTASGEQTSVVLREPATLRDADFVLRYAVDTHASPGAVVVSSGSRGAVAALVLHPIAAGGRPTALHLAAIDWGTLVVEDVPASNAAVNF